MRSQQYFLCGLYGVFLATVFSISTPAGAADEHGKFSVRGAGLLSCEAYTKERAAKSVAYQMIGGWIDGYITAYNATSRDTFDITSYQSTEMLAEILERHCKKYPTHRLFNVLRSITAQLHDQRLDRASSMQRIVVKGKETYLYAVTIARIQVALAKAGLLKFNEAKGQFDDRTVSALAQFQKSKKMQATGFPDQATLWQLLK